MTDETIPTPKSLVERLEKAIRWVFEGYHPDGHFVGSSVQGDAAVYAVQALQDALPVVREAASALSSAEGGGSSARADRATRRPADGFVHRGSDTLEGLVSEVSAFAAAGGLADQSERDAMAELCTRAERFAGREEVVALLEAAQKLTDPAEVKAYIAAALDYARNDQEALAEGHQWADPEPEDGDAR